MKSGHEAGGGMVLSKMEPLGGWCWLAAVLRSRLIVAPLGTSLCRGFHRGAVCWLPGQAEAANPAVKKQIPRGRSLGCVHAVTMVRATCQSISIKD